MMVGVVSPLPSDRPGTLYGFKEKRREKGKGRKNKTFLDWSLETTFRVAERHRRIVEVYLSERLHYKQKEEVLNTENKDRKRRFWT